MASKVCNKEEDIILFLFINTKVYLQDSYNKLSYPSVIPQIEIGLGSSSRGVFRKSVSFTVY
jgi:hypothetical protein